MSAAPQYRTGKSASKALFTGACLLVLMSCGTPPTENDTPPREIHTTDYDLIIPAEQKALLILFPCFSCDAADTHSESKIPNEAAANGIAVLLMNFNEHIMMSDTERKEVIDIISGAVTQHKVNAENTFIGGFSSGGNVTMFLAKSLLASTGSPIQLKGVFAVDSPLDLSHVYEASKRRVERPGKPEFKGEARMVLALLDSALGDPATNVAAYEARSPLTTSTASALPLKDLPVRFYTEPDTTWWMQNREDSYADMNAFALERLHATLKSVGNTHAEFITTKDRGIQRGNRHPHAWSIVAEQDLVKWMLALRK